MYNFNSKKKYIFIILLTTCCLVYFYRNPQNNTLSQIVYTPLAEIQVGLSNIKNGIFNSIERYFFIVNLRDEYNTLKEENLKLKSEYHLFAEISEENKRLKEFVDFKKKNPSPLLLARVASKDFISSNHLLTINKGSSHGIQKYMGVIHPSGVVGYVFRTTPHSSQVITILNELSSLPALNQRNRISGLIQSGSRNSIIFKQFSLSQDFKEGDLIISQETDRFPIGIPVGTIDTVQKTKDMTVSITVKPQVSFSSLEEVFIILTPQKNGTQ